MCFGCRFELGCWLRWGVSIKYWNHDATTVLVVAPNDLVFNHLRRLARSTGVLASEGSWGDGNETAVGGKIGRGGEDLTSWRLEGVRDGEVGVAEKVAICRERGEDGRLSKSSAEAKLRGRQLRGRDEGEEDA